MTLNKWDDRVKELQDMMRERIGDKVHQFSKEEVEEVVEALTHFWRYL